MPVYPFFVAKNKTAKELTEGQTEGLTEKQTDKNSSEKEPTSKKLDQSQSPLTSNQESNPKQKTMSKQKIFTVDDPENFKPDYDLDPNLAVPPKRKRGRKKNQTNPVFSLHHSTKDLPDDELYEIRRRNLDLLIRALAGGNLSQFADTYNIARASTSQLVNGRMKISNKYVMKFSTNCGIPDYILDTADELEVRKFFLSRSSSNNEMEKNFAQKIGTYGRPAAETPKAPKGRSNTVYRSEADIPVIVNLNADEVAKGYFLECLNIEASAGPGAYVDTYTENGAVYFSVEHYKQLFKDRKPADLKVIRVKGDSMEPVLSDQQSCVVELVSTYYRPGIYVFTYEGTTYIKRLDVKDGQLVAFSENPDYKPFPLTNHAELMVQGRLLLALGYNAL